MRKKMIIFMPSVEGGGVEKNFFIISNYLANKFDKVFLVTAENNLSKKIKNIEIVYPKSNFWRSKGRIRKYIICVSLLIKILLKNRNIFVFTFQANLYAILICKLLRIKVISRSNSSPSGWSKNFIKSYIYKVGLNFADTIIVNSIEFKNEMKKKFSLSPIHIYNPLNKIEIIKNSKKKITLPFYKKKTTNFINIGRLVDQKNQLLILKSFKFLKENTNYKFKLLIIGNGKNKKILLDFINKNNLKSSVKIINFKKNPFPYLKKADAFILSSIFEGLPNVLLEALTLKKLIISSDCPTGPKEILDKQKGGLIFKMNNEFDLYKKIVFFIENKSKCKKLVNYGHKRLIRFDYNENLEKYLKLLNS